MHADSLEANVLRWATTIEYKLDAGVKATDKEGVIACSCQDFKNSNFAMLKGVGGLMMAPACGHIMGVVKGQHDKHLMRACAIVDNEALQAPLEIVCYWEGDKRYLTGLAYVVLTDRAYEKCEGYWWDCRFEVFSVTERFLGYLPGERLSRLELGMIVAQEYMTVALEQPCSGCGQQLAWTDLSSVAVRWNLLRQGISLVHRDNLCENCTDDDLIPKV